MICFPFVGDIDVGGGHRSALLLLQHLDARRFQPTIIVHGRAEGPVTGWLAEHAGRFTQHRVPGYVRGSPHNRAADLRFLVAETWRLARLLGQQNVRIVHINEKRMLTTWALATRLARAKLVWHDRSDGTQAAVARIGLRLAHQLIAISAFTAGDRVTSPKCVVIDNPFEVDSGGPDRARWRRRLLEDLGLAGEIRVVGFFANLNKPASEYKRPLVMLESVARLQSTAPHLRVAAAVFGTVRGDFRQLIAARAEALGIRDRVHLLGFRHPPEPWLAGCDVLLAPAVGEPHGRTLVEAMLVGTPVIAADSGGHREIVADGETGFLVPADEPSAFAERALAVLNDDALREALTVRAYEQALARFGAQRHANEVMTLYERLLGGRISQD